jgi:F0F1-type ATP synthase delta subunit
MSRYTPKQYATALFESLQEKGVKADAVVKSFAGVVAKNYDRALLPKIIMQLKKLERSKGGIHEVVLTSARPLEKAVVVEIKKKVGEGSHIKEVVDEEVLGGLKILINDEMVIDGTYKTRINRMVEAVIKAVE